MSDNQHQYWSFGRKEVVSILAGLAVGAAFGAGLLFVEPAPPWWHVPRPHQLFEGRSEQEQYAAERESRWQWYEELGGHDAMWVKSAGGWAVIGGVVGLIASNVVLRGKSWDDW